MRYPDLIWLNADVEVLLNQCYGTLLDPTLQLLRPLGHVVAFEHDAYLVSVVKGK